jgi:heavy metal sensor kinase
MTGMNTRSIRFRLVAWYAGLLIAVFCLLGLLVYGGLKLYLDQSLAAAQVSRARQIAETLLTNIGATGEPHVVNEINSWFAPETNDRFIRITRGDGSVLYASQPPNDLSFDPAQVPPVRSAPAGTTVNTVANAGHNDLLVAAIPYVSKDGHGYLVEVGASLGPVEAVLRRYLLMLGLALAAMVAIATAGGYLLVGRALGPVDQIARSAQQITLHNLKDRLPVTQTGDELERLSVSLNHMIARLDEAFQQNRRFTADASHELRTPLTIMRGELESIVRKTRLSPEAQAIAASILEEVENLAHIVEGLFAISRLDAGEAQQEWVEFDLGALAAGTADQMCLLAEDKEIAIACETGQPVPVQGDRARIKQVVVNLLDNAIKYTPAGGKIRLSASVTHNLAVLEVADNGIGIPADAQPHIFERFFRVDKARSREMGGAGLGLSIIKSICAAHGGRVHFRSKEGEGTCFTVELPLVQTAAGKG